MSSSLSLKLAQLASLGACLAIGCGQGGPRADVIGEITLDGDPVAEAEICLTAKSPDPKPRFDRFSAAVIDGAFEFTEQTAPPPGEYEVIVKPIEPDSEEAFERLRHKDRSLLQARDRFLSAAAKHGPIRVELSADDVNEIRISLTTR